MSESGANETHISRTEKHGFFSQSCWEHLVERSITYHNMWTLQVVPQGQDLKRENWKLKYIKVTTTSLIQENLNYVESAPFDMGCCMTLFLWKWETMFHAPDKELSID